MLLLDFYYSGLTKDGNYFGSNFIKINMVMETFNDHHFFKRKLSSVLRFSSKEIQYNSLTLS